MDRLEGQISKFAGVASTVQELLNFLTDQSADVHSLNNDQPPIHQLSDDEQSTFDNHNSIYDLNTEIGDDDDDVVGISAGNSNLAGSSAQGLNDSAESASNSGSEMLSAASDNPFVNRLNKYNKQEKTAAAVSPDLASFVNHTVTNQLELKKYQELAEKFSRPINANYLLAPRVNRELWKIIPEQAQKRDIKSRKLQGKLINGMCPLVQALQVCGSKPEFNHVKELISDSFELLANVSMDININRREALRPDLKKASHLANKDMPVTDQLFGDDVEAEFKKIETSSKLVESIRGHRYKPYNYRNQQKFSSQNFRGQNKSTVIKNMKEKAKNFLGSRAGTGHSFAAPNHSSYRGRQSQRKGQGRRRF